MQFRTELEILEELLHYADEEGVPIPTDITTLNDTNTNNQYFLNFAVCGKISSQLENKIEEIYNGMNITTAEGIYLDWHGESKNIMRAASQPARADITITTPAVLETDIVIPMGTQVDLYDVYKGYGVEFFTVEEVTIMAGTESVDTTIESSTLGLHHIFPENAFQAVIGFPTLQVTSTITTSGSLIEDDDLYRERIRKWKQGIVRGSREMITDYLIQRVGSNMFKLIPAYNGAGTLKVVVDVPSSQLGQLADDVKENAMAFTDTECVCVQPTTQNETITLTLSTYTGQVPDMDMFKVQLQQQTKVYVEGGTARNGETIDGLGIGENLNPSQLILWLLQQFPEIQNISTTPDTPITAGSTARIKITTVTVEDET